MSDMKQIKYANIILPRIFLNISISSARFLTLNKRNEWKILFAWSKPGSNCKEVKSGYNGRTRLQEVYYSYPKALQYDQHYLFPRLRSPV